MTATPTPDPEARCSESRIRKINADEARECLSRFVASHFRDGREHARFTIPADVNRDDDLLLGRFIDDSAHALASASALLRECRDKLARTDYWRATQRDGDGEGLYEYCRSCGGRFDYYRPGGGDGITTKHKPDCKHVDLLTRIDRELAKEA